MTDAVLALNAGSSSVKFALFEIAGDRLARVSRGQIEGIGTAPHFIARDAAGATLTETRWPADAAHDHAALFTVLLDWVDSHLGGDTLVAVGHRVVHGGRDFVAPARLDPSVIAALDLLTPLAPLHQPHSLAPVRAIATLRPGLPQIACFDTAFHHTMPPVATRLALPRAYEASGVRRYGFHGLSYEYIARQLRVVAPELAKGRVIVAHLGSGASLCAMLGGRSIDTTMSFTALDGLVMGTRCGTLDPGVVLYMLQQQKLSPDAVQDVLYRRSGLLGVSGLSSDMRALLASDAVAAREAVDLYCYRIAREAGGLVASLGGLDGLVFTAGIGEHAAPVRDAVCARLRWLGGIAVHVIPTDEEAMIALHTRDMLR